MRGGKRENSFKVTNVGKGGKRKNLAGVNIKKEGFWGREKVTKGRRPLSNFKGKRKVTSRKGGGAIILVWSRLRNLGGKGVCFSKGLLMRGVRGLGGNVLLELTIEGGQELKRKGDLQLKRACSRRWNGGRERKEGRRVNAVLATKKNLKNLGDWKVYNGGMGRWERLK